MNILCVIDHLGSGGAQRQMVLLARGLQQRGHRVEFMVYHPEFQGMEQPLRQAGIPIHARPKPHRYSPKFILALRRHMRAMPCDVVLSFLGPPSLYAELAAVGARTAVVASERSAYPPGALSWRDWMLQQAHHLADHIVVNSHHQRERMEQAFPWMQAKISTIVNGVGKRFFEEGTPHKAREKGEGASGKTPMRLLVAGRLSQNKNASGLVEALVICREQHGFLPRVNWAGRRDRAKISDRQHRRLLERIEEQQLGDAWTWLGERDDIPALLRSHDALALPSFREGLPNAVCEAMAAGRPVLASDVGDHRRLLRGGHEGARGYLFDPEDPQDIARALHDLHQLTPRERREMGSRGRAYAREALSEEALVDRYEQLFQRVASGATHAPAGRPAHQ